MTATQKSTRGPWVCVVCHDCPSGSQGPHYAYVEKDGRMCQVLWDSDPRMTPDALKKNLAWDDESRAFFKAPSLESFMSAGPENTLWFDLGTVAEAKARWEDAEAEERRVVEARRICDAERDAEREALRRRRNE